MSVKRVKPQKEYKILFSLCLILISLLLVVLCVYLEIHTTIIAADAASDSYKTAEEESQKIAYQEKYDDSYNISREISERANHVKNRAVLELGDIQERADLEVLEVSASDIIVEKPEDNEEKNESWLRVTATGVYTVDLSCAEFIFDEERQDVIARIPKPKMDKNHYSIIESESLFFRNDKKFGNGSDREGEALRTKQKKEAFESIYEEIVSNQEYYENAEKSAENIITTLIKRLNPDYKQLKVNVEFVE